MDEKCQQIWPELDEAINLLRQAEQIIKKSKLHLVKAGRIIGAHEQFATIAAHAKTIEELELNTGYIARLVEATLSEMQTPEHKVEVEQG